MGTYEWRDPGWVKKAVTTEEIPQISFNTDASALGNQVQSGFKVIIGSLREQLDGYDYGDVYNKAQEVINGEKVGIYANGQLLDTSKVKLTEEYRPYKGDLIISKWKGKEGDEIAEMVSGKSEIVPSESKIHTIKDLFQVSGIDNVQFKPIQESSQGSKNNAMENSQKMGVGLLAGVAAAAYVGYKVILE